MCPVVLVAAIQRNVTQILETLQFLHYASLQVSAAVPSKAFALLRGYAEEVGTWKVCWSQVELELEELLLLQVELEVEEVQQFFFDCLIHECEINRPSRNVGNQPNILPNILEERRPCIP